MPAKQKFLLQAFVVGNEPIVNIKITWEHSKDISLQRTLHYP